MGAQRQVIDKEVLIGCNINHEIFFFSRAVYGGKKLRAGLLAPGPFHQQAQMGIQVGSVKQAGQGIHKDQAIQGGADLPARGDQAAEFGPDLEGWIRFG